MRINSKVKKQSKIQVSVLHLCKYVYVKYEYYIVHMGVKNLRMFLSCKVQIVVPGTELEKRKQQNSKKKRKIVLVGNEAAIRKNGGIIL